MRLLFVSIPTYQVVLSSQHAFWHRVRRLCADRIYQAVTGSLPTTGKKSLCRGLWLLASEASRAGHDVRWIDVPPNRLSVLKEDLVWAEQIWLYAMTPTVPHCLHVAELAKKVNANVTVLLGGPHTRYLFEETLQKHPQLDFVEAYSALAQDVALHVSNAAHIPGIAYRDATGIKVNDSEFPKIYSETVCPSVLPSPLASYYVNTSSSRGCNRTCSFCVEGREPLRLRQIEEVKDELKMLNRELGENAPIHFFDASLWAMPDRCMQIAEFIAKSTSIPLISCDLEAQPISDNVLHALANARVHAISIGFESCDNDVLRCVAKNGTFEQRIEIAKYVREAMPSTVIKAYWLLGLPGSSLRTLNSELTGIRYVLEEGIVDLVSAKLFVPYPGTHFFEKPDENGLKLTREFEMFDRFFLPPACCPSCMHPDDLARVLLECEQLVAKCYADRLGVTYQSIAATTNSPRRYNGPLYIRKEN